MKAPPTNNFVLPAEWFPLVKGEPDEEAAYDAYLTLPSLLEYRAIHQGDRPFLYDPLGLQGKGEVTFREFTFEQVWLCIQVAAVELGKSLPPRKHGEPQTIVGFIGRSAVDYLINEWALQLLGHAGILVSLTNTPGAIAALMKSCGASDIVHHPDQLALAEATSALLDKPAKLVKWWAIPSEDERLAPPAHPLRSELSAEEASSSIACVHHSSGSTGNPKPLPCRHRAFLSQSVQYCDPGIIATPLNHIYPRAALLSQLSYSQPAWIFPHTSPLSPGNLLRVIESALPAARGMYLVTVLLGPLLPHVPLLRKYNSITCAGAPPPPAISQALVDQGVHFAQVHGMSECGWISHSFRDYPSNKEWSYIRPADFCAPWVDFRPVPDQQGTYQLFLLSGMPSLHASNCDDGSYDTKDLWVRHPTDPGLWKYVSRTDEIIVHSNGLKTDPWPVENKLNSAVGVVKEALVVGANRNQPAVLVMLEKPYQEVKETIWGLLEEVNLEIPTFSRIVPELVIPLEEGEDFIRSTKRNIIRPKSEALYKERIDAAYAAYEGEGATGKLLSSEEEAVEMVREVLARVFPVYKDEDEEKDFFAMGMNSIKATRVRNSLQSQVKLDRPLDQNVAFNYNTPKKLAHHLWNMSRGLQSNGDTGTSLMEETQALLDSAISAIRAPVQPKASANGDSPKGRVVLLTGATGGLGAHVLLQLATSNEPTTILCPVRSKGDDHARQRVDESLAARALPSLDEVTKGNTTVLCFPADLDSEDGIMKSYPPRFTRPAVVYHNAWPVNFNYTLPSFLAVISSVVNLINLFPHAHHIIASSILAAHTHSKDGIVPEEIVPQPPEEMRNGYGRSKWIAEKIAEDASAKGVKCTVARIGQITGDTEHGIWTADEAPPIMVRSAATLQAMPDRAKTGTQMNWIPMDSAAWILSTLGGVDKEDQRKFELVNVLAEDTMDWSVVLEEMRNAGMEFETVSYDDWIERINQAIAEGKSFPAQKLLQYFENATNDPPQPNFAKQNLRRLLTETLQSRGEAKADASQEVESRLKGCDRKLVRKMLASWKERGLL